MITQAEKVALVEGLLNRPMWSRIKFNRKSDAVQIYFGTHTVIKLANGTFTTPNRKTPRRFAQCAVADPRQTKMCLTALFNLGAYTRTEYTLLQEHLEQEVTKQAIAEDMATIEHLSRVYNFKPPKKLVRRKERLFYVGARQ